MSFNRSKYDTCSYKQNLQESVNTLGYILSPYRYEHKDKCRHQLGFIAGTSVSHIKGNIVDLESDLRGQTRYISKCGANYYIPTNDNIIKNDSLSGGRASYEGYTQGVIDKMATGGKEEAKEYLYKEKADLLKRQPWLRNANPVRRNASKAGGMLNEIEQNIASIDAGEFDWALKESLTEKDLKLVNDITAAIKKLSGDNEKYLPLREEIDIALARVDDDVTKLSASDRKKYDQMMSLEGGLRTSMKYVRSLRDQMSNDGKKWFSARVDLFNPAMFNTSTADFPLFEEQTGLRLRVGESDPSRLKNLDELVESLNKGVGKVSAPASTVAPTVQQMPQPNQPTNITPAQVIPLNNTPYTLEPVSRAPFNVEGQITSVPNVIVVPVDDRGSEGEPSASTPTATAYPSLVTSDPLNDYLGFTRITYG